MTLIGKNWGKGSWATPVAESQQELVHVLWALLCVWSLQRVSVQEINADKHWVGAYPQQTQSFEVLSALAGRGDSNQKTEGKMQNRAEPPAASLFSFVSVYTLESPAQVKSYGTPEYVTMKGFASFICYCFVLLVFGFGMDISR